MKKVSIIYASTTGNTRRTAEAIKNNLNNYEVEIISAPNATKEDIENSDLIILGSATYGSGELDSDFDNFYETKMSEELFKGKDIAVFACGNIINHGATFAMAADTLTKKAKEIKANIITGSLKLDGQPKNRGAEIKEFANKL